MDYSKKSDKITEIVRLQQILKKWKKLANSSKTSDGSSSNGVKSSRSSGIKFLKRTLSISEASGSGNVVPKGCLAIIVGGKFKRFVIPTQYLRHPAFRILLREAEEEFGFEQEGVLRIPCEVTLFESVVKMVEEKREERRKWGSEGGGGAIIKAAGCCSEKSPILAISDRYPLLFLLCSISFPHFFR